jgi:hypothetical protein
MNLTKANDGIDLIFDIGELNVSATANFGEDTAAMLDSLYELFQECGDKVTATFLADRMESKLNRHIHHHRAAYLYRLHGFYSRCGKESKYYVIPDFDLLARLRMKYCKIDAKVK